MTEKAQVWSDTDYWELPMGAVKIEKGDNVSVLDATGHCKTGKNTDHGWFAGVAQETIDNSAGVAGAVSIKVRKKGAVRRKVHVCAPTQIGKPGFLLSGETFCMSTAAVSAGAGSMWAGTMVEWINSTLAVFDISHYAGRGYSATS